MDFINPYSDCTGRWVRGNLHGHCREHSACASVPLLHGARRYHDVGAGFMAVTDHDHVTELAGLSALYPDMAFLHGFEYSSSENMLFIGERVPPLYNLPISEALARKDGLLTVVCHPQPRKGTRYWTKEMIQALRPRPAGMEVYNGHYSRSPERQPDTNPLYTDLWDELLSEDVRLWGFADDDFHDPEDFGKAYNMVCVPELSPSSVLGALKAGRFYATTGLLLDTVGADSGALHVRLASPARGRFVGPGGKTLAAGEGRDFSFRPAEEAYVRFEAEGKAGRIFLQPLFRRPGGGIGP